MNSYENVPLTIRIYERFKFTKYSYCALTFQGICILTLPALAQKEQDLIDSL